MLEWRAGNLIAHPCIWTLSHQLRLIVADRPREKGNCNVPATSADKLKPLHRDVVQPSRCLGRILDVVSLGVHAVMCIDTQARVSQLYAPEELVSVHCRHARL